jgi:predicted dehydrogenase
MMPLGIGIIGCGRIVQLAHLPILRRTADVQVTGIAEPDPASRSLAATLAPGATICADVESLLALPALHAVVIAIPTPSHHDAAVAALARGLHVYLEKPIAPTLAEGESIVAAWRRAGTVGVIGFNLRFNRLYREMRDAIRAGAIGTPISVRSSFTACWPGEAAWRIDSAQGGGALLELASHHVDLCRFLFDAEIVAVDARRWSNRGPDEAAMLHLSLGNGVRVQTHVGYGTVEEDRFEVYGSEGKLVVDRYNALALERVPLHAGGGLATSVHRLVREVRAIGYGLEKRRTPAQEPSYTSSLRAFVEAARTGRQGRPDFHDGLQSLRAIDAARASAARHAGEA